MPVFIIRFVFDWGVGFSLYRLNKFNEEKNKARHKIRPMIPIKLSKFNKGYDGIKNSPKTYEITNNSPKILSGFPLTAGPILYTFN